MLEQAYGEAKIQNRRCRTKSSKCGQSSARRCQNSRQDRGSAVNGAADALGGVCGMSRISRGLTILMAAVARVGQVCERIQPYSGSVCPRLVLEENLGDQ